MPVPVVNSIFDHAHYFSPRELEKQVRANPKVWERVGALLEASALPEDFTEPRPIFTGAHFWTDDTLVYQVGRALFPQVEDSHTRTLQAMVRALLPAIVAKKI